MIPTVRLELRPSRWLAACLGLLHLLALAGAWFSLSSWSLVLGGLGVTMSLAVCLRQVLHRQPASITLLLLHGDQSATWRTAVGGEMEGRLLPDGVVLPWLVILALENGRTRARQWLILGPDSAEAESLRKLRVRLLSEQAVA